MDPLMMLQAAGPGGPGVPPPGMGAPPMPPMAPPGGGSPAEAALPILAMLAPQQAQQQSALYQQQVQDTMMTLAQALQNVGNPAGARAASEPLDGLDAEGAADLASEDPTMMGAGL